jgi:hypothetical protein
MSNNSQNGWLTIGSMQRWQIILTAAVFLAARQSGSSQQFAPGTPPSVPPAAAPAYPQTTVPAPATPITLPPPPYVQTAPVVIQPGPASTIVPPPGAPGMVVPLPSQTPGSIFGPSLVAPNAGLPPGAAATGVPVSPLDDLAPGGVVSPQFGLPPGPELVAGPQNVIAVPVVDDDWAWEQIADVVSDYFQIAREQRARRGEVSCEGRIETAPQTGATWLEPQRRDSVGEFNRWESTFQTIRRRALVRVIPDGGGYLVEVVVQKELEDLPRPEHATAGSATFGITEGSLPSRRTQDELRTRSAPCWIQLGRDPPLEQRMLMEIHARLAGITTAANPSLLP